MGIGERSSTDSLLGTCPLPQSRYEHILLGHGSGGKLTADLIQKLFVPGFGDGTLAALEDQATLNLSVRDDNGLKRRGLHSRPTRSSSGRFSSREATSGDWPCTAR